MIYTYVQMRPVPLENGTRRCSAWGPMKAKTCQVCTYIYIYIHIYMSLWVTKIVRLGLLFIIYRIYGCICDVCIYIYMERGDAEHESLRGPKPVRFGLLFCFVIIHHSSLLMFWITIKHHNNKFWLSSWDQLVRWTFLVCRNLSK
jgi:hypothetical protein